MILRDINKKIHIGRNDLEFAKDLFNVPLPERTNWLSEKIANYAGQGNIEEYIELTTLLNQLC